MNPAGTISQEEPLFLAEAISEKLSHLLFSVHSEFQVPVLKDVSLSICTWKSWPLLLIYASTVIAVK